MRLVVPRSSWMRFEDWVNSVGIVHGLRLILVVKLRVCKLVRPLKQALGIEVKLLESR